MVEVDLTTRSSLETGGGKDLSQMPLHREMARVGGSRVAPVNLLLPRSLTTHLTGVRLARLLVPPPRITQNPKVASGAAVPALALAHESLLLLVLLTPRIPG